MFASKDTLLTRPSGYNIARSVRTRSSATAYFNRTFTTPTDNKKWTMSMWLKRGSLGGSINIFGSVLTGGYFEFRFNTSDQIYIQNRVSSTNLLVANTTAVYRDPSAWYHIVFAFDSANATAANRNLLYVNGVNVALSANSGSGDACAFNSSGNTQYIGNSDTYTTFDGYMAEINFVDGQALTPSSFGETDSITGVWKPKAYSGTYGTNGFELNFSDNSNNTAATIGKDYSGNGNNWTPNNISVTAGVTYDSMTDVPTLTSATAANYCVCNPLDKDSSLTLTNGNLDYSIAGAGNGYPTSTFQVSTGKWYWEVTPSNATQMHGVALNTASNSTTPFSAGGGYGYYGNNGNKYINGTGSAYGSTYTSGDIIGVALDLDSGTNTVTFYKNNVSQGAITITSGQTWKITAANGASATAAAGSYNFGQRPFSYTPPTGYVALNTYNLPASTIKNGAAYMAATLWNGDGSTSRSISTAVNGVSFQPDFVWVKARNNAREHILEDSVRGLSYNNQLSSNSTGAESSNPTAGGVTGASSTTITLGGTGTMDNVNKSTWTYVGWQWKAGTTSSSNTNGSITSTVSVGATQGFSVVTYTGNGSTATVGHGLGVAPNFIIVKSRTSSVDNWQVYHASLGNTQRVTLNTFNAADSPSPGMWNSTSPTSTVFSVGNQSGVNSATTYVAYCFAAVAGYSAFGSYTGNGSADGVFVYLGFRPRYVMLKCTSTGGAGYDWYIWDTSRMPYNLINSSDLQADQSSAEGASGITVPMDIVSNGFKIRTSSAAINQSSQTFIYIAFAENPFRNALAR
jgi:hypothetical protein